LYTFAGKSNFLRKNIRDISVGFLQRRNISIQHGSLRNVLETAVIKA